MDELLRELLQYHEMIELFSFADFIKSKRKAGGQKGRVYDHSLTTRKAAELLRTIFWLARNKNGGTIKRGHRPKIIKLVEEYFKYEANMDQAIERASKKGRYGKSRARLPNDERWKKLRRSQEYKDAY